MAKATCKGKVRYGSQTQARRSADRLRLKKDRVLAPYKCKTCFGWHLGGNSSTRSRNLNIKIDKALRSDEEKRLQGTQARYVLVDDPEDLSYSTCIASESPSKAEQGDRHADHQRDRSRHPAE